MSSSSNPPAALPCPVRAQCDTADLTAPLLPFWTSQSFLRNPQASSSPCSSSPSPLVPGYNPKQAPYDYPHALFSPQLDSGTIFTTRTDSCEDPHGLWHHRLAAVPVPHTHVKFQSYPASAYLPQTSFACNRRYNTATSSDRSECTDAGFDDDIRSGQDGYLSDQDDQMDDGFSFSELGTQTMSFRTSAERGRWRTDPIPQRPLSSKTYESVASERSLGQMVFRPTSEPAPSILTPTCPSDSDKQKQRDSKPEVISALLSPLPTSPLVLSGHRMGEESELPLLTSDRDSSMDVDEPVSELLTPSSPLLSSPPFSSSPLHSPLPSAQSAVYAQARTKTPLPSASSRFSSPAYPPPFLSSPLSPISSEIGEEFDIDVDGKQITQFGIDEQETESCDDVGIVMAQDPSKDKQATQSSISDLDSSLTPTLDAHDSSLTCAQSQATESTVKLLQTEVDAQIVTSERLPRSSGPYCQPVKCVKLEANDEDTLTSIPECLDAFVKSPSPSPSVPVSDQSPESSLSPATIATIPTSELTAAVSTLPLGMTHEDGLACELKETLEDVSLGVTGLITATELPSVSALLLHNVEEVKVEEQEEMIVNVKRKVSTSIAQKRRCKASTGSRNATNSSAPLSHDNLTDLVETRMRTRKPVQQERKRKYIIEESSSSSSDSDSDSDSDAASTLSDTRSSKAKFTRTKKSERLPTGPSRHTYPDDDDIPRDPNGIPLADSEICGMIIEGMATSRASSLPISQICRIVLQSQPAMKEKSEKEWESVFGRVLRSGSRVLSGDSTCRGKRIGKGEFGKGSGVFEKVDSSYKDDTRSSIEARWFYVPENDCDQERAALIKTMMLRPGKRNVTKKYKQYYYQPLDKISRWDPEDDL